MSQLEYDYDEVLRRALHAAADMVEPAGDGLERIRARLTAPRQLAFAWMLAGYSEAAKSALGRLQPLGAWLRAVLDPVVGRVKPVIRRFQPAQPDATHPLRRFTWLRPAAAMATAVVVVAMGAFALTELPQAISDTGSLSLPGLFSGGSGGHAGQPGEAGHGTLFPSGTAGSAAPPAIVGGEPKRTGTCPPSKRHEPSPSPSPSPSTDPSPTPSPSVSPTPSPSPTATSSPSPSGSASPAPGSAVSSSPPPGNVDAAQGAQSTQSASPASVADFPTSSPSTGSATSPSPRPCASRHPSNSPAAKRRLGAGGRPVVSRLPATTAGVRARKRR